MKKIFFGLLVITSLSAQAECFLEVSGMAKLSNCGNLCINPIEKVISKKGWTIVSKNDSRAQVHLNLNITRTEPEFKKLYIVGSKVDYFGVLETETKAYPLLAKGRMIFPNLPSDCGTPLYQNPEINAQNKIARKLNTLLNQCY